MVGYATREMGPLKCEAVKHALRSIMMAYPGKAKRDQACYAYAQRSGVSLADASRIIAELEREPGMLPSKP